MMYETSMLRMLPTLTLAQVINDLLREMQSRGDNILDYENAKAITIEADWGRKMSTGRQILPGENQMDGFYYAKIQKLS